MSDLEQQLAKVVEKSLTLAEQTGEFIIEQAPDLLQQFYYWHTAKYCMGVLAGIILIFAAFTIPRLWMKKVDKDYECRWDEIKMFNKVGDTTAVIIPFITLILGGVIMFCINVYYLVFVLTAPKLYLIEYFIK